MLLQSTYASDYAGEQVYVPGYRDPSKKQRKRLSKHVRGEVTKLHFPWYILVPGGAAMAFGIFLPTPILFLIGMALLLIAGFLYCAVEDVTIQRGAPKTAKLIVREDDTRWKALKSAFPDVDDLWDCLVHQLSEAFPLGNQLNDIVTNYLEGTTALAELLDEMTDKGSEKAEILANQLADAAEVVYQQVDVIFKDEQRRAQEELAGKMAAAEYLAIEQTNTDDMRVQIALASTMHLVNPKKMEHHDA